ncbi:MAG: DUF2220 domain-containing protein [Spirochaetaceae bacterium]|nr:DUF2220 domain-containing protein [Spirochaetaceae bacterium]
MIWEKYDKKNTLKSLMCVNKNKLFKSVGKTFPRLTIKRIKNAAQNLNLLSESSNNGKLLSFVIENLTMMEIEHGINLEAFMDFYKLTEELYNNSYNKYDSELLTSRYSLLDGITPRALSIKLYNDSKRIDLIKKLFSRVVTRAKKKGIRVPDFSFITRSFPETLISGRISIHFKGNKKPMINSAGYIIGLPLKTIIKITKILAVSEDVSSERPTVLTVENKETFYALTGCKKYSCLLYTGGYPSRAVVALARILSKCGFKFFHAGDVDPDGILILQELAKSVTEDITPVCMDADTFNKYRRHGRKLEQSVLHNIRLINDRTRAANGITELLKLIESTGLGIEQEVIDYGHAAASSKR